MPDVLDDEFHVGVGGDRSDRLKLVGEDGTEIRIVWVPAVP